MAHNKGYMVIASFHQTLWNITSVSSGSIRVRNIGKILTLRNLQNLEKFFFLSICLQKRAKHYSFRPSIR